MLNANEEALLKEAFKEYYARLSPAYPGAEELAEVTISDRLERRMERLFRRQKHFYYKLINTAAKRAACIAAALLLVVAGVGTYFRYAKMPDQTVEGNKNGAGEGYLSDEGKYPTNIVEGSGEETNCDVCEEKKPLGKNLYPTYIVEGYEQTDKSFVSETLTSLKYRIDQELHYIFQQTALTERDIKYFETVEAEWITVAGRYPGYYEVSAGLNHLWYYTEDYCIVIWGTISNEELLKVAESVDYGPENRVLAFFEKIFK